MALLGLGTAQFGLDYGISNNSGCIPASAVVEILDYAKTQNIIYLDTAPAYGHAERILGAYENISNFKIISKLARLPSGLIGEAELSHLETSFHKTLSDLHTTGIYGLIVHDCQDLRKPGAEKLVNFLRQLRVDGLCAKIGVSIYHPEDIDITLNLFTPDLIQVPFNVFDQRLVQSGTLKKLKTLGVEIHARSVFLQGLLLMDDGAVRSKLPLARAPVSAFHMDIRTHFHSPAHACLAFVNSVLEIDVAIVGVTSLADLRQLCTLNQTPVHQTLDFARFAQQNMEIINPTMWKKQ